MDQAVASGRLEPALTRPIRWDLVWQGVLTAEDRRGLTPLFWGHILPYGQVNLNMTSRLALGGPKGSDQADPQIETAPGDQDG